MQYSLAASFEEPSVGRDTVEEYTQFRLEQTNDNLVGKM